MPAIHQRPASSDRGGFPATRISAIVAASSDDRRERERAWEALVAAYWMPVYKYIRVRWGRSGEDAKDLTQGFFADAIEKRYFHRYEPDKARFRTFLRSCLDGFVANHDKAARRIKRGGDAVLLSLDFDEAESQLAGALPEVNEIDGYFEREFARSLFTLALETLRTTFRAEGKEIHLQLFERYVLSDDDAPKESYKELAEDLGISVSNVTNYLAATRRDFRRILLGKLRDLTVTDEEFRSEARLLLGVEPDYQPGK